MLRCAASLVLAAVALSGCYQSHRGGPIDEPGDAAQARDVGPPPPFDAGPPPPFDSGPPPPFDGGPPPPFDGGLPPPFDGGPPPPFDAGPPPPRDAGPPPPRDAGPPPPPRDAGPPPPPRDAGPPRIDGGPLRPALRFSSGTFFSVADAPSFRQPADSTFELWVRSRETGSVDYCGKGGDAMARDLVIGQRGGELVVGWSVARDEYFVHGPPVVLGEWTHVAMVRRITPAGDHRLLMYVNGALAGVLPGAPHLDDAFNDLEFRCGLGDFDVDEIRFWRIARSERDLAASMGVRVSGGVPGMVSYWRLDERGQIALDYTATGLVGVLGRLTTPDGADPTWIRDGAI